MENIFCLRCNTEMNCIGEKKLQLGETGWILGDLPNLLAGAMEVSVYTCPKCGKIEFFQSNESSNDTTMTKCPQCGKYHDFDYPKCPFCKYDYYK